MRTTKLQIRTSISVIWLRLWTSPPDNCNSTPFFLQIKVFFLCNQRKSSCVQFFIVKLDWPNYESWGLPALICCCCTRAQPHLRKWKWTNQRKVKVHVNKERGSESNRISKSKSRTCGTKGEPAMQGLLSFFAIHLGSPVHLPTTQSRYWKLLWPKKDKTVKI